MSNVEKLLQRKYINMLSIVGVLILIFLSFISYLQVKQLKRTNDWIIHTHEVIETADNILVNIGFAESIHHRYLLKRDKSYIKDYNNTITQLNNNVGNLQKLTRDNSKQQERITQLTLLLKSHITSLNNLFKGNLSLNITQDKTLSEKITQIAATIIDQEKQLLLQRSNAAFVGGFEMIIFEFIGTAFSIALIFVGLLLLNQQLTYRTRAENELSCLAYYDVLTGLPNRTLIMKKIEQAINGERRENQAAVLLIGLDNFKNINDSLGQEVGDELLISFTKHLQGTLRAEDMIARLSGDAFVVFAEVENTKDATSIAHKILHGMTKPLAVGEHKIFITVSMGISIYPDNGLEAKILMKNADIALSRAKELGKNNYQFCTPEMSLAVKKRALLDYDLHHALENNEFILLYQPKVSLLTKALTGVEVLMRWRRSKDGWISPQHFIPLAESNGLIVTMGEWMLRAACQQGKIWQKQGLPLGNIAINVSTRQLLSDAFVASVERILSEADFDPHCLEIEVTESVLMENSNKNIAALHKLKEMGISITLDDFGTGYSSLNYLRIFAIDKLKIDKSFVQEIHASNPYSNMINAIITMAHSLAIKVIAEGVETQLQVDYLEKYHCDEAQGFFYSRPLLPNDMLNFLSSRP